MTCCGQGAAGAQALVEGVELLLGGQGAVEQEVADLFEARVRREVVDGVAAVEQDALLAVDEAGLGLVEHDVAQAFSEGFGHGYHRCLVYCGAGSNITRTGRLRRTLLH